MCYFEVCLVIYQKMTLASWFICWEYLCPSFVILFGVELCYWRHLLWSNPSWNKITILDRRSFRHKVFQNEQKQFIFQGSSLCSETKNSEASGSPWNGQMHEPAILCQILPKCLYELRGETLSDQLKYKEDSQATKLLEEEGLSQPAWKIQSLFFWSLCKSCNEI